MDSLISLRLSYPRLSCSEDRRPNGDDDDFGAFGLILVSPADPGYGSVDESRQSTGIPTGPQRPLLCLDGDGSWDGPPTLAQEPTCRLIPRPNTRSPGTSSTSWQTPRERGSQTFWGCFGVENSDIPRVQWYGRALYDRDRFVPVRRGSPTATERYHMAGHSRALSLSDRLTIRYEREHRGHLFAMRSIRNLVLGGTAFDDGRGRLLWLGSNARLFTLTSLAARPSAQDELKRYRGRVAVALEIDRVCRILDFASNLSSLIRPAAARTPWDNGRDWPYPERYPDSPSPPRIVLPTAPFRVLDAPCLRDDYYCSILAYSATCQTLAVGLGNVLYT
ncbi:hypothetical protein L249_6022 [Ophiocordyceps polyrhachis-furcata BCC 54312]|uniref:Uncharacterized protein n=1 Tax=Ophiocordyceps polyrhachis-furcata BCC 54312 TaxID=1330021 RepID=A0A367LIX5_9HYPO|nr:hypothetical protein L249_6022 [Ophiocordyceps polyrhachis-furcata BCC 54312]